MRPERVEAAGGVGQLENSLAGVNDLQFTTEELTAIDRDAVEARINIWAASSAH
jgi:L-glyceraldehyde 3-phosphate reductase